MSKTHLLRRVLPPLAAALCGHAGADDGTPSYDDRFYMAPMGSYAMARSNNPYGDGYGGRAAVGKLAAPHLGFELLASYLYRDPRNQGSAGGSNGLCGLLGDCPSGSGASGKKEFGQVGAGLNLYLFRSNHGLYAHAEGLAGNYYGYAGGLGYDLRLTHQGFGLRLQALYHKDNPDRGEPLFNAGFFIPFGDAPVAARAPEQPVNVVPVEGTPPAGAPPPPAAAPQGGGELDGILPDGKSGGDTPAPPANPDAH
jgi:hypothetical protein